MISFFVFFSFQILHTFTFRHSTLAKMVGKHCITVNFKKCNITIALNKTRLHKDKTSGWKTGKITSSTRTTSTGALQGCVLAPLTFSTPTTAPQRTKLSTSEEHNGYFCFEDKATVFRHTALYHHLLARNIPPA